jgi:hypothetical protein
VSAAPRVSAILITHDYGRFLGRAIESVLDQDHPAEALEVIVVDDGSTDDTPQVAAGFGERIRYVRQPNGGLLSAINRGLTEATGEYLAFHSGDDAWLPGKVRRLVEVLEARPEVGLAYGDMEVVDAEERPLHPSFLAMARIRPHRGHVLGPLVRGNFVSGGGLMVRASLRERFHPLPPHAGWEDWWIAVRVAEVAEIEFVPEPVHRYRFHGANMNLGADARQAAELARAELPFRRWLLTDLQAGAVEPADLLVGWRLFAHAARAAAAAGEPLAADRHAARAALAAARRAEDLGAAVRETVRALGHDPTDADASALLEVLAARIAPFHATPLPIEARSFVTAAFADELVARPELLAAYGAAFGAEHDATLLVALPADAPEEALDRLSATVSELGLDGENAADLAAATLRPQDHLAHLDAVLSSLPLGTLPRADEGTVGDLARWAGAQSAAGALAQTA